jgi:putative ABC transport system permease protein
VITVLHPRPALAGAGKGGVAARRAVIRWAWRLFRREWRQQILLLGLLALAVAITILAAAVAYNAPASGRAVTFGTANKVLTLTGGDPHLAADIASVKRRFGAVDVIENQAIPIPGSVGTVDLRAQDPHGRFGQPMLSLVSGHYPTGPDEVAVTSGVASLFGLPIGGLWRQGGHARRVTGLVENPANLLDEFALVSPGQVGTPTQLTILFDAFRPHPCTSRTCAGPLRFPGGATAADWASFNNGMSPTTIVLVVAVFGLIFIGLVAMAGFTVMAQRRRRALGMIGALGATDANVGLVMIAGGGVVGAVGTLIGAGAGFGAWLSYAPHLQGSVEHRIHWSHLPWPVIAAAMVLAVVTAIAAAWRPARSAARIPVVSALSGRPAPPKASYRSAVVGAGLLGVGLWCLASAGGWTAITTRHGVVMPTVLESSGGWAGWTTGWTTGEHTHLLFAGIAATAVGALLFTPLAVSLPAAAGPRAPAAVRLALRDLGRYRARSGAVLAAVCFAVLVAVLICILTAARSSDPFEAAVTGPNLAPNQLIVYEPNGRVAIGPRGFGAQPSPARRHALETKVNALAASVHARFVLPLDSAGRPDAGANTPEAGTNQRAELWQTRGPRQQLPGPLYVATTAVLRDYRIDPGQIDPDTDIITSRRGLAAVSHLALYGQGDIFSRHTPSGRGISDTFRCPRESCLAHPKIQTFTSLPTGISAPSTLVTEHAVRTLGQHLVPDGWLVQTTRPFTAAQKNAARQLALAGKTRIEGGSGEPSLSKIRKWATAAGILLALAVLAMTVGLIRSETASDLRTLTAAGASRTTRRTLAATTAGALGLLGALLGTALAYVAVIAWAHNNLGATVGPVPVADLVAILVGLPLAATISGWLLAGREPPVIARQPLE